MQYLVTKIRRTENIKENWEGMIDPARDGPKITRENNFTPRKKMMIPLTAKKKRKENKEVISMKVTRFLKDLMIFLEQEFKILVEADHDGTGW